MVGDASERGIRAGLLLALPAAVAWLAGLPFVFPSLGPTAYLMATVPASATVYPRRVVGGHAIGVAVGLLTYHLLAPGLTITTTVPTLDHRQLQLAASALASVVLTTAGMTATDTGHAPACATTLIVSLGLLSSPVEAGILVAAVVLLVATDRLLRASRLGQAS